MHSAFRTRSDGVNQTASSQGITIDLVTGSRILCLSLIELILTAAPEAGDGLGMAEEAPVWGAARVGRQTLLRKRHLRRSIACHDVDHWGSPTAHKPGLSRLAVLHDRWAKLDFFQGKRNLQLAIRQADPAMISPDHSVDCAKTAGA